MVMDGDATAAGLFRNVQPLIEGQPEREWALNQLAEWGRGDGR